MKFTYLSIITFCSLFSAIAQTYSLQDLENQLIKNNGSILANKYNIKIADAEIIQEKLWANNPTFSIKEINLWKAYGYDDKNFTIEIEQLFETANKRKKRIALKELSKNSALFDYEELLRELKKDLRISYNTLERINQEEIQLSNLVELFKTMNDQYQRQTELNNLPKVEFFRIQSELIGYEKELIDLENEKFEVIHQLRLLTFNPNLQSNQISFSNVNLKLSSIVPSNVLELAKNQNIEMKRQENEISIANKSLELEKAQKIPDLELGINYDNGIGLTKDVLGVGLTFNIPILNNNKGNIKAAQFFIEQEKVNKEVLENSLSQQIIQLQNQLKRIEKTLDSWKTYKNSDEQLLLIENYKKHLQNKQVTLIEFLDFTEAYREANQAYFELKEAYNNTFQELQYIVGKDF